VSDEFPHDLIIVACLRAVHSYKGAIARWEQDRITGLDDDEFSQRVRYELGISGGGSLPEPYFQKYFLETHGLTDPWIKIKSWDTGNEYLLRGAKLFAFLRDTLQVGYPVAEGAVVQGRLL